jgi:hypothetical protein
MYDWDNSPCWGVEHHRQSYSFEDFVDAFSLAPLDQLVNCRSVRVGKGPATKLVDLVPVRTIVEAQIHLVLYRKFVDLSVPIPQRQIRFQLHPSVVHKPDPITVLVNGKEMWQGPGDADLCTLALPADALYYISARFPAASGPNNNRFRVVNSPAHFSEADPCEGNTTEVNLPLRSDLTVVVGSRGEVVVPSANATDRGRKVL